MTTEDILLRELKDKDELLKITKTIRPEDIPEIKERKFFLDRLVLNKKGVIGYIIPIILTITLFIIGFTAGIYSSFLSPGVDGTAQAAYTFWVLFILFGTYLLNWEVWGINNVIAEANQKLDIPEKKHKRWLSLIFGFFGIIMSILIALPFILYDITGFGTGEGWLIDVYESGSFWYPGADENPYGFGSILWLLIWIIPWFYFGAVVWLSLIFLFYMNMLKKANWRYGIQQVVREKQYKKILALSIAVYAPVAPYLVIKLIFQIFYLPWWSDTIGTYILFAIFFIGVAIAPFIITKDIKGEKLDLLSNLQRVGNKFFDETVRGVFENKPIEENLMMKAMILRIYNQDMVSALEKKVVDRSFSKKIMVAALAPVISIIVKIVLGGALAF